MKTCSNRKFMIHYKTFITPSKNAMSRETISLAHLHFKNSTDYYCATPQYLVTHKVNLPSNGFSIQTNSSFIYSV